MDGLVDLLFGYIWSCFQSHERLKAEIVVLRHQLNILKRKVPKRPRLSDSDRALFVWLYRLFPHMADAITIIHPETVIGQSRLSNMVALEIPQARRPAQGRCRT